MIKVSKEKYEKALGQLRLQLNDVFTPFQKYGQQTYIGGAIDEIIELAEKFAMRVRDKDVPIILANKRNPRDI